MDDRDVESAKRVFVGDPRRRISIAMPLSLGKLLSRVREAYGVCDVDLYVDPENRTPGEGRWHVRDEAAYRTLSDGAVVVFVSNGRDLDPCKLLDTTTYRTDFVAKDMPRAREVAPPARVVDWPWDYPPKTTYARDYVPMVPQFQPPTRDDDDNNNQQLPARAPFEGKTTYQTDFVLAAQKALPKRPQEDPVYPYVPERVLPRSVYANDFTAYPQSRPEYAKPTRPLEPPEGARWAPTEYKANYYAHQFKQQQQHQQLHAAPPVLLADPPALLTNGPPKPRTTYQQDYVPHAQKIDILHVEPHVADC